MGNQLVVWCQYCRTPHYHSAEDGHRGAHCVNQESPYRKTGYVLERRKTDGRVYVLVADRRKYPLPNRSDGVGHATLVWETAKQIQEESGDLFHIVAIELES